MRSLAHIKAAVEDVSPYKQKIEYVLLIMILEELQALRQEIKDAASVRPEVDGAGISGSSTAEASRNYVDELLEFDTIDLTHRLGRIDIFSSPSVDDDDSIR